MNKIFCHPTPKSVKFANLDINRKGFALTPIGGPALGSIRGSNKDHDKHVRHVRKS